MEYSMTDNSKPKRNHHVVPRHYLKGFVIKNGEPFIWVYKRGELYKPGNGKITNNPYKDSIRCAGAERDFYADPKQEGGKDFDTFENKLESLEKPANPIFDKLREQHNIDGEEKRLFSEYLVLTWRRVRAGRAMLQQFISKPFYDPRRALSHFNWPDTPENRAIIMAVAECLRQSPGYDIQAHNRTTAASSESFLIEPVVRMTWTFYTAPKGQCFLTSDNPVHIPRCGLGKNISELSFPIASNIALVASWSKHMKEGYCEAHPKVVKEINRRTASMASHYIYTSINEQWVVKLLNNSPHEYHPIYSAPSVYNVFRFVMDEPGVDPHLVWN